MVPIVLFNTKTKSRRNINRDSHTLDRNCTFNIFVSKVSHTQTRNSEEQMCKFRNKYEQKNKRTRRCVRLCVADDIRSVLNDYRRRGGSFFSLLAAMPSVLEWTSQLQVA